MVKASALYIVIVIALVIALLCSSLIGAAYFYRLQYQQKLRYDVLETNLQSAVNLLLASAEDLSSGKKSDLFDAGRDSISLKKLNWGAYDICIATAFIQKDTLFKVFSTANSIDSAKWGALYVIDEDRPLSVSGKTLIRGNAFIPKAGVREAYVDNKAYEGDKKIILGQTKNSQKKLPALNDTRLKAIQSLFTLTPTDSTFVQDSLTVSFRSATRVIYLRKQNINLQNCRLSGNIIIRSDSTLTIDSTCKLKGVIIAAKAIALKNGFTGSCQLFARDSISIGSNCSLAYPSCLGVVRSDDDVIKQQEKIVIGQQSRIEGIAFTYEKKEGDVKPIISMEKRVKVYGNIYSQGLLNYKDGVAVYGNVFTSRFLYQTTFTRYENYLINITLDASKLSHYYLTSDLLPISTSKRKILQWIESN